MKEYIKPTFNTVELRVKEDITLTRAKVPTSIYKKGANGWTDAQLKQMALSSYDYDTASNM